MPRSAPVDEVMASLTRCYPGVVGDGLALIDPGAVDLPGPLHVTADDTLTRNMS